MKAIGASTITLLVILSLAATYVPNFSSPMFLFSLFNSIVLAIFIGSYRPLPSDEIDDMWPSFQHYVYIGNDISHDGKNSDDNNNDDDDSGDEVNDDCVDKSEDDDNGDEVNDDSVDKSEDDDNSNEVNDDCVDESEDHDSSSDSTRDEDDNKNGHAGEHDRKDDDEFDDNLEKKIEEFIAMMNKGWREERLKDRSLSHQ